MVSMTIENAGCPSTGRITSRSTNTPKMPIAAIEHSTDSQKGKPSMVISTRPQNAPSIIRSPWAKVTVSVAL